ncbi:MAG: CCA tRNA nucleotidyltransferase [Nitrospirae bacterium]|nr:CCA tRNA nucleotidyltransferase [Candidatus Troglogloeales bacterium]
MSYSVDNLSKKAKQLKASHRFLRDFENRFDKGEVYLVGGAVRDFLLGRNTQDADFLIRNVAASHLHNFLSQHGKANFVGKNFGVYKFIPSGEIDEIDVALPRTERSFSYQGGYRDFEIETNPNLPVEEDLKRRDFTVNAIALDMKRFCLIDPFNGLQDLESKVLRAVGEPHVRFSEDHSRLMRGLRFVCQFDFSFDPETQKALFEKIAFLNAKREDGTFVVPRETIAKEFLKALCYNPVRMFDLWDQSGAFLELIPELLKMKGCPQPARFHSEGDVWTHTRLALEQLTSAGFKQEFQEDFDAEVALAVLLHDVAKPNTIQTPEKDGVDRIRFNGHDHVGAEIARDIVKRLKLSSLPRSSRYYIDEDGLAWLIEKHLILVSGDVNEMRSATIEKYFLNPQTPGQNLMRLIFCDGNATIPISKIPEMRHYYQLKARLEKMKQMGQGKAKAPAPFLSGREIMALLEITPGPLVGKYLSILREEQLSGRVTHRDEAISFLKNQSSIKLPLPPL